jgi:hypothetical protein
MFVIISTLYYEVQILVIKTNHEFGVLTDCRYVSVQNQCKIMNVCEYL